MVLLTHIKEFRGTEAGYKVLETPLENAPYTKKRLIALISKTSDLLPHFKWYNSRHILAFDINPSS